MDIQDISPELREKALACKSKEELAELAKSVGVSLSDEQVDAISGSGIWASDCNDYKCKKDYAW